MSAERRTLLLAAGLLMILPGALRAQGEGDSLEILPMPVVSTGTAVYDEGGRRDPFVPLTARLAGDTEEGPRFDSLRLTGVFLGTPGSSLVVLEDPAKRGYFLRVGERIGNAVLIEIRPRSAVFEIREYGAVRRQILELLERSEGTP